MILLWVGRSELSLGMPKVRGLWAHLTVGVSCTCGFCLHTIDRSIFVRTGVGGETSQAAGNSSPHQDSRLAHIGVTTETELRLSHDWNYNRIVATDIACMAAVNLFVLLTHARPG